MDKNILKIIKHYQEIKQDDPKMEIYITTMVSKTQYYIDVILLNFISWFSVIKL